MLLAQSCNGDDDAQQNSEPTLNTTWSLINVSGGFAGVDDDFESGIITWHFNNEASEITVINNDTSNAIHSGYASGTYTYEVITTPNDTTLVIGNTDLKITTLTSSQLILDEGMISDGFQYTFSR
ncbi:hypothetical protein ADIWIN_2757 [Winogradskyella psychrotolerans RS-3]|uniref:Lipocalin-like domain-containing protein n=2 Tax=Winogradskyella TaxID=286104 RepID=S7VSD4_9FLAO|nr:hypothetical protein ADIWIN_2757 [Winogradskyella psychrotolerans RS-3]